MWVLLANLGFAAELKPLELTLSPGSTIEVLPALVVGRVDVVVHDNTVDLAEQVGWTLGTGITRIRPIDMAGHWLLTLELKDPGQPRASKGPAQAMPSKTVRADRTSTGWALTVVPALAHTPAPYRPVDLIGTLEGKLNRAECPTAPLALRALSGSDSTWESDALGFTPDLPRWSAGEPSVSSLDGIGEIRALLRKSPPESQRLEYQLGALHRNIGHDREAAYYFTVAAQRGGPHASAAWFQAAQSLLSVKQWDRAVESARAAVREGGAPQYAVLVLGVREWATGGPDQAGYGRVLSGTAADANSQLIAGVLLTEGNCALEAQQPLDAAASRLRGFRQQLAMILLGDSHLAEGNIGKAATTLAKVEPASLTPEVQQLLRSRTRLLALLRQPAATWRSQVPNLTSGSDLAGTAGLENLYLLGQVFHHLGEDRQAIDAYSELIRRKPQLAVGHIGAELATQWALRSDELFARGRPIEALSLHRGAWTPALAHHLKDLAPLRKVATGFTDADLPQRAQAAWRAVADEERARGLDGRGSVVELLRLYIVTSSTADALDAVAWLRREGTQEADRDTVALLEGDAALQNFDPVRARKAWGTLSSGSRLASQARTRLALLNATEGRCEEALPHLDERAATPVPEFDPDVIHEARLKCMLAVGRDADAATEALTAAGLTTSDQSASWKAWRATRLAAENKRTPPKQLADATSAGTDIWGALAQEEERHRAFIAAHRED